MRFKPEEIELAQTLKRQGLSWTPSVGHFVWDQNGLIEAESPFHDRVFFILDLKHFLRRSGTIDSLAEQCCWLPTWFDARQCLKLEGVSDTEVAERITNGQAISTDSELLTLYRMIQETLDKS